MITQYKVQCFKIEVFSNNQYQPPPQKKKNSYLWHIRLCTMERHASAEVGWGVLPPLPLIIKHGMPL